MDCKSRIKRVGEDLGEKLSTEFTAFKQPACGVHRGPRPSERPQLAAIIVTFYCHFYG